MFFVFFSKGVNANTSYVDGGVSIERDWGIYDVKVKNFNDVSCNIENRQYVYTVTEQPWNSGINPIITIDLKEFGMNQQAIYRRAFKTLVVIFQITLREEADGYQEFYLINPSNDNYLAEPLTSFEHGGNTLNTEYKRYELYTEVPCAKLTKASFSLAFSAHGFLNDNWKFGNVRVQICTSNEECKINNIRNVTNAKTDELWTNDLINEMW